MAGATVTQVVMEVMATEPPTHPGHLPENSSVEHLAFDPRSQPANPSPATSPQVAHCGFPGREGKGVEERAGMPVLGLSLASAASHAWHTKGAPSPHSPIDTHCLCSGTH